MSAHLSSEQLQRDLTIRDLTDPNQGHHAIQLLIDSAVSALVHQWNCEVRYERGQRVVSIADNYDRLRFEPESVSRDIRYTRYVNDSEMLRSHSSAIIPEALRSISSNHSSSSNGYEPVLLACPGIVYRRDSIDRLHSGTPHQMDLWLIWREQLTNDDLDTMIQLLVSSLTPGREYRCESRIHPYTLEGRQVDVKWNDEWIEIAECGLAHPDVLTNAGLVGWSGLALGMGLDRLLMLRKAVPDIRLLRSNDKRISNQMLDLEPYRLVSSMPPISRDLSVAVDEQDADEDIGDRVRDALTNDAELIEQITVLSSTSYDEVPEVARMRIGMNETQKNILVRIVLRAIDRTLTQEEANQLRDRIYTAIHQGSKSMLS